MEVDLVGDAAQMRQQLLDVGSIHVAGLEHAVHSVTHKIPSTGLRSALKIAHSSLAQGAKCQQPGYIGDGSIAAVFEVL